MRDTHFLRDWIVFDEKNNGVKVTLPYEQSSERARETVFSCTLTAEKQHIGQTAYLCFPRIHCDAAVFDGEREIGFHRAGDASFNFLLSENVLPGQVFEINVRLSPNAHIDGGCAFRGAALVTVSRSHFDLKTPECIKIDTRVCGDIAFVNLGANIVFPNNYDIISYTVIGPDGTPAASKTAKPTDADTVITVKNPQLWDGQTDPALYTLSAVLKRDSAVLDELNIPFAFRTVQLRDGFFRLNTLSLPLNGIELSDCFAIKSDMKNFGTLDANLIISSALPEDSDLLSVCDRTGNIFCYALPFGGGEADFELLREFLTENRRHPSLAFVMCAENADGDYIGRFVDVMREYAPGVYAAAACSTGSASSFDPDGADIVVMGADCTSDAQDYISMLGRFDELAEKYPDKYFAVAAKAPSSNMFSDDDIYRWHIRLWESFCRQKRMIAYSAGILTDKRIGNGSAKGLVKSNRSLPADAFWFYKSRFSARGFIKICTQYPLYDGKGADIKCFTNRSPLRLLVNGKDKKYKPEKVTDGVYVYRKIKLRNGVNTIEASAGDECDRTEIIRS